MREMLSRAAFVGVAIIGFERTVYKCRKQRVEWIVHSRARVGCVARAYCGAGSIEQTTLSSGGHCRVQDTALCGLDCGLEIITGTSLFYPSLPAVAGGRELYSSRDPSFLR